MVFTVFLDFIKTYNLFVLDSSDHSRKLCSIFELNIFLEKSEIILGQTISLLALWQVFYLSTWHYFFLLHFVSANCNINDTVVIQNRTFYCSNYINSKLITPIIKHLTIIRKKRFYLCYWELQMVLQTQSS